MPKSQNAFRSWPERQNTLSKCRPGRGREIQGEPVIGAGKEARGPTRQASDVDSRNSGRIAVDAHVHLHEDRLVSSTLDAAAANFSSVCPPDVPVQGMLLLAESSGEHIFDCLASRDRTGEWQLHSPPGERETITATNGASRIVIVCGQQIRCVHGIEILALGTRNRLSDGLDPDDVIDQVMADGAIPVVPWGFGKWIGRAGRIVKELFNSRDPGSLFVGDNGGRLELYGTPGMLRHFQSAGFRVLPGSDPFPFGGDYRRVGGFGFLADARGDPDQPWSTLRNWLLTPGINPVPYGRAVGPARFLVNQTRIQIRKRMLSATNV